MSKQIRPKNINAADGIWAPLLIEISTKGNGTFIETEKATVKQIMTAAMREAATSKQLLTYVREMRNHVARCPCCEVPQPQGSVLLMQMQIRVTIYLTD